MQIDSTARNLKSSSRVYVGGRVTTLPLTLKGCRKCRAGEIARSAQLSPCPPQIQLRRCRSHEGQHVVGAVHANTIEGFCSILKRGVMGAVHKVSKKYLPLYVAEFQFRYNNRMNARHFRRGDKRMLKMAVNFAVFGAFVLIVAVLGFFLWQTLFAPKEYGYGQENSEPAYSEQQPGNENAVRAGAPPSSAESTDKAIAEYTKWLAIFTLFLVLATIGLFISGERNVETVRETAARQLRIMQGQLTSMLVGQRPWVYADVALYKPTDPTGRSLWFEDDGLHISIAFTLHNTGNLPANSVRIEMRPRVLQTAPIVAQRELCDPLRATLVNALGTIGPSLFPGQTYTENQTWVLPIEDIQKDTSYTFFSELLYKHPGQVPMITPLIVGCVDYQIPGRNEHHQTRFAFRLAGSIELRGNSYSGGVPLTKEPLPIENFWLSRDIDGRLYAAD